MSFYRGRYAELYDLLYRHKPYADEARFVYDRLSHYAGRPPQRILELACGTGTHAIEFARFGCNVTATDCSAGMLDVARRKVAKAGESVAFAEYDMRALPVPDEPYDAIVCLFDSIGYVQTDEYLAEVFRGVRRSLKPDGLFLFEFWHAAAMLEKFDPLRVRRIVDDGQTVLRIAETHLIPDRSLARVDYDLYELKADLTYDHFAESQTNRFFTVAEMEANAETYGFAPLAAYSGFSTDTNVTAHTWHVVAVWQASAS